MIDGSLLRTRDGSLRAPWRLATFAVLTFAAYMLTSVAATSFVSPVGASGEVSPGTLFATSVAALIAVFAAHVICVRWLERRPWSYVALERDAAEPARWWRAALLGSLAIGLPTLVLVLGGWMSILPAPAGRWWDLPLIAFALLAPAALAEELLLRGYLFRVLRDVSGPAGALGITSVLFGLLHVGNPGATPAIVGLVILAGVFLGGVLLATGSLYAAWAAHLAWNWTLLAAFHTEVSGLRLPVSNYTIMDAGPDWATGGAWGPEGGAGAAVGMAAGLLYLHRVATAPRRKLA